MRLVYLEDIALLLPGRSLFDHVTWSIFMGERYGLVGANGSGKTTLLRLMTKEVEPSHGSIERRRDLSVGYLPQEGIQHEGRSLFEEAWNGLPDLPRLRSEIDVTRHRVSQTPDDMDLVERLGVLEYRWQDLEGYHAEAKVARVLGGLGFKSGEFGRPVEEFSGGWQMRVALAKLLLFDPDLLLLDEPTNHLDLPALLWLEEYLTKFKGALVIVSHDRRFLDRVVSRIAEIDRGKLTLFVGNFSDYERDREARREQLEARAARIEAERQRIEAFVERFRYKATKARQVQSRIKMLEKIEMVETEKHARRVRFRFPPAPASGRVVLEMSDVGKAYGSLPVFTNVDLVLTRGEKIALVGANGAGKSTLCRLIAGVEDPTTGKVRPGHNVCVDYFAQDADFHLDKTLNVLESMETEGASFTQAQLRGLLGAFLFSGDDVYKPVSVLSGGEKSRLALARMLLHPSNFIILDEPTNHLDMASQSVLLEALNAYDGTLLIVSHDRFFLDQLVDRVLELDEGVLRDWHGNLSEYLQKKASEILTAEEPVRPIEPLSTDRRVLEGFKTRDQKRAEAEIRNRLSTGLREARDEVERLQREIDSVEARQQEIESHLADEALYHSAEKSRSLVREYEHLRTRLPELFTAWEAAATRLEELEREKEAMLRNA